MTETINGRHQLYSGTQDASEFAGDFRLLEREPYFQGSRLVRGDIFGDPIPVRTSTRLPDGYMRLHCVGTGDPISITGTAVNYSIDGGDVVNNANQIPAAPVGLVRSIIVWADAYTDLNIQDGGIFDIELYGVEINGELIIDNQPITVIDLNGLTSLGSLALTGLTELVSVFGLSGVNGPTILSTANLPKLKNLDISNTPTLSALVPDGTLLGSLPDGVGLEKLRVVGVGSALEDSNSYHGGLSIQHQRFSAEALNQVYTDLIPNGQGQISITGNPGAAASDTAIATDKGYTVFGA